MTWLVIVVFVQWLVLLVILVMNAIIFRQLGIMVMGSARGMDNSGIPLGKKLPAQSLTTLDGSSWRPEDWLGRSYVTFFGATYCKECVKLLPIIEDLKAQGLEVVTFLFSDNEDDARAYVSRRRITGPVIQTTQELGHLYDAVAVPFGYAIGANGAVRDKGLAGSPERLFDFARAAGVSPRLETSPQSDVPTGIPANRELSQEVL
jgi:hypothetical protein